MKLNLRNRRGHRFKNLHRRLLPFYMKPLILIAFMTTALLGMMLWSIAISFSSIDQNWLIFGFAFGIVVGFIQGKWTSRMWEREYLRVLRREITFWQAKGGKGTTIYVVLALGVPIFWCLLIRQTHEVLVGLQSYIFGFIGGMNFALYLWVRRLPR